MYGGVFSFFFAENLIAPTIHLTDGGRGVNQHLAESPLSHIALKSRTLMSPKRVFFTVHAGDLAALKEKTLVLKEGAKYRMKIDFKVRWLCSVTRIDYRSGVYSHSAGCLWHRNKSKGETCLPILK